MMGYAGSRDYVGTPQSPQKIQYISTHPTKKQTPTLSLWVLCGLLVTSNSSQPAQNSCERVGVCFSLGCVDMCGPWGLLWRLPGPYVNPETRRTPWYELDKHNFDWRKKISTDSFVSDDPRVYEPVCYEMLVAKEYYIQILWWSVP